MTPVLTKTELFQFVTSKELQPSLIDNNNNNSRCSKAVIDCEDITRYLVEALANHLIDNDDENKDTTLESKEAVDEAVFMQSYIPTTLHDINNPYAEMDRIQSGQREPVFEAAIRGMLGTGDGHKQKGYSDVVISEGSDNEVEKRSDSGEEEDEEGEDSSEDEDEEGEGKYRKQLPSRDDPEIRKREKDARREAKKISKTEKALKRQNKIPKHVKKRAVKAGKK